MGKMHVKTGDTVIVIAGKEKGKKGKVKTAKLDTEEAVIKEVARLEKAMFAASRDLQFEEAAELRDQIRALKENLLFGAAP